MALAPFRLLFTHTDKWGRANPLSDGLHFASARRKEHPVCGFHSQSEDLRTQCPHWWCLPARWPGTPSWESSLSCCTPSPLILCSHLCFPKSFKIIFLLLLKMKDKALKYETYTLCQALSRSYKFWKKFGGQEFPAKTKLWLRPSWSRPLGTVPLPGICRTGMLG